MAGIFFSEVDIDDEIPIVGYATLIESTFDGVMATNTLSFNPPLSGEDIVTCTTRMKMSGDYEQTEIRDELETMAFLYARTNGYELVIPDDYFFELVNP